MKESIATRWPELHLTARALADDTMDDIASQARVASTKKPCPDKAKAILEMLIHELQDRMVLE